MSNFLRRLKYYGIGFGLGLLFVVFFFQNRGCSWTPSNRVKSALLERVIALPESQTKSLDINNIKPKELKKFIQEADVDFKASNKTKANKFYKLTSDGKTLFFTLTNESFISSVFVSRPEVKDTKEGIGKLILFPDNKDLVFTDTTGSLQRIRTELGYKNDQELLKTIKKNSFIVYGKSDFKNTIKPEHYLEFTAKGGEKTGAMTIWYKDKININKFILSDSIQ
jgi:hypothetical protein